MSFVRLSILIFDLKAISIQLLPSDVFAQSFSPSAVSIQAGVYSA